MKGSKEEMDIGAKPEDRAVVGQLIAEDYATLVNDKDARLLFSELIADILHAAHQVGQEASNVLNRAVRIYGRDGGVVDIGGEREARQRVAVAVEPPAVKTPERPAPPPVEEVECNWEEPPHVQPPTPHWEEPPDLTTSKRGRFARFEQLMRDNPNRWLVLADGASGSYASGLRKQYGGDFEFEHKRMRRSDKRSYRVWARFIGKPTLKACKETG